MPASPVELAYRTFSNTTSLSRRCGSLIIAHGLLGNAVNWTSASRRLLTHPSLVHCLRDVYSLDMRNHGSSPHSPDHSNNALASDLESFVLRKQEELCGGGGDAAHSGRSPDSDAGTVVMGHSMGGLAVMSMLLRRYNESLFLPAHADRGLAPRVDADERAIGSSMSCVNTQHGFGATQPIRDVLFDDTRTPEDERLGNTEACGAHGGGVARNADTSNVTQGRSNGRVNAAIIVDIAPNSLDRVAMSLPHNQSTDATLRAMAAVDMAAIHSYDEARVALERGGIADAAMREFVMTNIVLDKDRAKAARWRCNLSALARGKGFATLEPTIVRVLQDMMSDLDTQDDARHTQGCTLPVLFVFGTKSPYNVASCRDRIPQLFPNSIQLEVAEAGHFVHYENLNGFVDTVAPFLKQHLDEK